MVTLPTMSALNANDLRRIFDKLDKNADGFVSLEELNWLLERIGVQLSVDELESSVGKRSLNFNEFLFFYDSISKQKDDREQALDSGNNSNDSDLAEAFQVFDLNGDGFISCEELQSMLSRLGLWDEKCGKDCRKMICAYDSNLDGFLDFEEFKTMMLQSKS